ncbi:MAG: adenylate/guanylate cyclase domain-containing protein [Chloroflexota bacterium]
MNTYRKIVLGMVASNSIGAFLIFFYFANIDIESFRNNQAFWEGSTADWTTFTVVVVVLALVSAIMAGFYGRRLALWEKEIQDGLPVHKLPPNIRLWAQGYPILIAAISLLSWLIAGLFFSQGGLDGMSTTFQTFIRTFVGIAIVGGLTTASLVFLITDALWREKLPLFFPHGQFKSLFLPRITIRYRLIAGFLLTGFVPLLILATSTRNGALMVMLSDQDPYELVGQLERLVLFVVIVALISNFFLSYLTARSVLRPLNTLSTAMSQVADGDLAHQVPITANDEVGDLSSHFNQMVNQLSQSQRMRDLFGRYVSKEVAERVISDGADLGGEDVAATALFADIRDFTGLSERLPAHQVVDILNRYYTHMVDAIVAEGGIVNKFGGDSLLAVFGVPIRQPDHALRAVQAAWRMNRALAEFNAEQLSLGLPSLTIGIGISSGEMIAGNIGGEARLEYTVIGDPVNVASRLESLTKEFGKTILISEDTTKLIKNSSTQFEPVKRVQVKGKTEPKLIYGLVAM